MSNPNEKDSVNPIIPLVVGAAVGGALAYLFARESASAEGEKLTETLSKSWNTLKEKLPFIEEELNNFKDKMMDTVVSNIKPASDHVTEQIEEV